MPPVREYSAPDPDGARERSSARNPAGPCCRLDQPPGSSAAASVRRSKHCLANSPRLRTQERRRLKRVHRTAASWSRRWRMRSPGTCRELRQPTNSGGASRCLAFSRRLTGLTSNGRSTAPATGSRLRSPTSSTRSLTSSSLRPPSPTASSRSASARSRRRKASGPVAALSPRWSKEGAGPRLNGSSGSCCQDQAETRFWSRRALGRPSCQRRCGPWPGPRSCYRERRPMYSAFSP